MAEGDVQVRIRSLGERLTPDVREALLRRAAAHAVGIIKRRTAKGVDVDGAAFVAYSKDYAKLKGQSGRNTKPDLMLSGEMLNGMTVLDVTPERALIGFTGAATAYRFQRMRTKKGTATGRWVEKKVGGMTRRRRITQKLTRNAGGKPVANALKAKVNNDGLGKTPRRRFFALSPEERREVIAEAARTLKLKP